MMMHRFVCAHLDRIAREKLDEKEDDFDYGLFSADLPRHVDGKPAPLPEWVLAYETTVRKDLSKLAEPEKGDKEDVKADLVRDP